MKPSRENLIARAERGVVPVEEWRDRDTSGAQKQLAEAAALLKAGCAYELSPSIASTGTTTWIEIVYPGFDAFEYGRSDTANYESDLYYIPTDNRLDSAKGGDWY
jgi:hypothetical protein